MMKKLLMCACVIVFTVAFAATGFAQAPAAAPSQTPAAAPAPEKKEPAKVKKAPKKKAPKKEEAPAAVPEFPVKGT